MVNARASLVTITVLLLIQSAVGILLYLTPEILQLLANQMLYMYATTVLNDRNYSEHVLHTHSPLIISINTGTQYFAAEAVLNMSAVNDLNKLDIYTLCIEYEQDSVVVRHERTNYTHAIACMLYST